MGLSISNATATAVANRLITKSATAGQSTLTATVATGTGTTAGSFVQATASTSAEYLLTGIVVHQANSSGASSTQVNQRDLPVVFDIATGGAGSEVVMATVPLVGLEWDGSIAQLSGSMNLAIPLRIPASTRLAVRAKKTAANAAVAIADIVVVLLVTPYANVEGN